MSEQDRSGFSLPRSAGEARRQLHISVGLVCVLATGIVCAGMASGGHPIAVKQAVITSHSPVMTLQAETKVTGAKAI